MLTYLPPKAYQEVNMLACVITGSALRGKDVIMDNYRVGLRK
jgi:hypothetical protein